MDSPSFRHEEARSALKSIRSNLIYKNKIKEMSDYITDLNGKHKYTRESEKLNQIITWVQKEKRVTKKNIIERLGWGRGIKWTPYRQALLKHPNIYDVMDEYPTYCWRE